MRILHTSDWHIGKTLGGYSLLSDQKYFLDQILVLIDSECIDVLLIAGDIYQTSTPSSQAVQLLNDFFVQVVKKRKKRVVAIAGNHDSPERLEYLGQLLEQSGFYIQGGISDSARRIIIEDGYIRVAFDLLPYLSPNMIKQLSDDLKTLSLQDYIRQSLDALSKDSSLCHAKILVAHGLYLNLHEVNQEDECLAIGGVDAIDLSVFPDYDYIALGHLHAPKRVSTNALYSGSPINYSPISRDCQNGVQIIDIAIDGAITTKQVQIRPLREVRTMNGTLKELLQQPSDDYVFAYLKDEEYRLGALKRMKEIFPHILGLQYISLTHEARQTLCPSMKERKSVESMFADFYLYSTGKSLSEKELGLLKGILEEVTNEVD